MNVSAGTLGHEHYDNKTFPFHLLMEKEGPKCIIMLWLLFLLNLIDSFVHLMFITVVFIFYRVWLKLLWHQKWNFCIRGGKYIFLEYLHSRRKQTRVDVYIGALKSFSGKQICEITDMDVLDFLIWKDVDDSGRTVVQFKACPFIGTDNFLRCDNPVLCAKRHQAPVLRRVIFWVTRPASPAKRRGPVELAGAPAGGGRGYHFFAPFNFSLCFSYITVHTSRMIVCYTSRRFVQHTGFFELCITYVLFLVLTFFFSVWCTYSQK